MSRDGSERRNAGPSWKAEEVYAGLVKENPPRSRSGSRGTAGFSKDGRRRLTARAWKRASSPSAWTPFEPGDG
jgi:hypothetical protein